MDPFTLAMIGTAVQMYGNYQANMDEAEAERQNQVWMGEQAKMIEKSTKRELDIYNRQSQDEISSLVNAFAKSGISMEGSAMALQQQEEMKRMMELDAIKEQGNFQLREAYLKIGASGAKQARLTSTFNNLTQAGATGLSGYAQAKSYERGQKD